MRLQIDSPSRSELNRRRSAGEPPDGDEATRIRDGGGVAAVTVPIAAGAQHEAVGGAADGDRPRPAVVADRRPHVLDGEGVGRVHLLVAEQTELS